MHLHFSVVVEFIISYAAERYEDTTVRCCGRDVAEVITLQTFDVHFQHGFILFWSSVVVLFGDIIGSRLLHHLICEYGHRY